MGRNSGITIVLGGLALAGLILAAVAPPARGELRVWTRGPTVRVLRADVPGKGDRASVHLSAAGNEWESFQVLVRSEAPVAGVTLQAGDLRGPGGTVIPAGEARLFRQHQMSHVNRVETAAVESDARHKSPPPKLTPILTPRVVTLQRLHPPPASHT